MLRRLVSVLAACLALIATQSAWAVPMLCRAEAEQRVCVCSHESGTMAADDCCTRSDRDSVGVPGVALPIPTFRAIRLPEWSAPPVAVAAAPVSEPEPAFLAALPSRGPPRAPRFLAYRSLLI
ncbi:hypothetical protein LBMAG42_50950 [Deltaproteobacteria bacterium]|nr:hypothetical protein LBMAG42_50950 [Deltaproteobacteria bacterium]